MTNSQPDSSLWSGHGLSPDLWIASRHPAPGWFYYNLVPRVSQNETKRDPGHEAWLQHHHHCKQNTNKITCLCLNGGVRPNDEDSRVLNEAKIATTSLSNYKNKRYKQKAFLLGDTT